MLIDANNVNDFPKLDQETLRLNITFGSYQLKYSFGYLSEHFNQNGGIKIFLNSTAMNNESVVSAKIQSRHSESVKYRLIIVYSPNKDDVSSILGWRCSCFAGKRKVGCCSLIACVIFYLSSGKYEDFKNPGHTLNRILYQIELSSNSENDKSDDDNSIFEDLIQYSETKCKKYKQKLTLSSSFETISIKSNTQDLLSQLKDILPKWGGKILKQG